MPNPGIFHGHCKVFLDAELEKYKTALAAGESPKDTISRTQRHYFKCYPVELPLSEDPTPEALATVNDNAADVERLPLPDISLVGKAAYNAAVQAENERSTKVRKLQGQVEGYLRYKYRKTRVLTSKASGAFDPYAAFYRKFLGIAADKPRRKAAHNI
ncbi:hypothetical protein DXG01_017250 [Tephrocybe rancida]|nr:hypothetical protein DXG01_017250 [Tephrocybe rancida]